MIKMAYKITDDCIFCGTCEVECPTKAISEGDTKFVIDPDKCTECVSDFDSPRCAEACPLDVPIPDPEHKESQEELRKKRERLRSKD
jgi:ferredoxin